VRDEIQNQNQDTNISNAEILYNNWNKEIHYAIDQLIQQERELVNALQQHAAMSQEDIKQECILKILSQSDWLIQKNWLSRDKNPEGYFYRIGRNKLIDLWRKYERKGQHTHLTLEENDLPSQEIPHQESQLTELELNQNLLQALTELIKTAEQTIRKYTQPRVYNNYLRRKQKIYEKWLT
jgi:DNA-directed RNA polymerase specialized sigma24 family protein